MRPVPITIRLTLVAAYPSGQHRELELNPVTIPTTVRHDGDHEFIAVDGDDALARIATSLRTLADEIDRLLAEP